MHTHHRRSLLPIDCGVVKVHDVDRGPQGYGYVCAPVDGSEYVVQRWLLDPGYVSPPRATIEFRDAGSEMPSGSVTEWLDAVGAKWRPGATYVWARSWVDRNEQVYTAEQILQVSIASTLVGYVVTKAPSDVSASKGGVGGGYESLSPSSSPREGLIRRVIEHWYLTPDMMSSTIMPLRLSALPPRSHPGEDRRIETFTRQHGVIEHVVVDCLYYDRAPKTEQAELETFALR